MSTPSTPASPQTARSQRQRRQHRAGKAPESPVVDGPSTANKELCKFFLRGTCKFGSSCRSSHGNQTSGPDQQAVDNRATRQEVVGVNQAQPKAQTRTGQARRGNLNDTLTAKTADSVGNNPSANNVTVGSSSPTQTTLSPTRPQKNICFDWKKKGTCYRGARCKFLHDSPAALELNVSTQATPTTPEQAQSGSSHTRATSVANAALQARRLEEVNAKRLAEKIALQEREAASVSQHTVLKSSIVTYGAGMHVRGVIAGFEVAKIFIRGLPLSASLEDVMLLFTQQGLSKDDILLRHLFTPRGSTTRSYEALLARESALAITAGLDGTEFREATLSFEFGGKTVDNDAMKQNDGDRKDGLMVSWTMQVLGPWATSSSDDVVQAIRERLAALYGGSLVEVKLLSSGESPKGLASVRFRDSTFLPGAVFYLRNKRLRDGHPVLRPFIPDPFQFSLTVPTPQYRAQKGLWDNLVAENNRDGVHMVVSEDARMDRARIRVRGQDIKLIGALKVRVETLAAGEPLDSAHYHQALVLRPSGRAFLNQVLAETGAFVRYDFRGNALKVYGNAESKEAARRMISAEVTRLSSLEWKITLQRQSLQFFMRRGLGVLKEMLGEDAVTLDVISCQLTLRGGDNARRALDLLLEQSQHPDAFTVAATGEEVCPVCYTPPSSPFGLACNHVYCTPCLQHYLTSAPDTKVFPLVCMGDEARCNVPIPIPVIQRFLTQQQYNHLVDVAFQSYIEHHPQEFRYCTTPDCEQIYKCNSGKVLECPSCFSEICSHCNQEGHEGMSCEERKQRQNQEEHQFDDPSWLAEQNIKRCPRCQFYIQKSEGCNHMECRCGAHMCWICVQVFDNAAATYTHLRDQHGGYFDNPIARQAIVNEDARLAAELQRAENARQQDPFEMNFADVRRRVDEARRRAQEQAERQAAVRRAELAEYQRRVDERQRQMREQEAQRARREDNSGWGCIVM